MRNGYEELVRRRHMPTEAPAGEAESNHTHSRPELWAQSSHLPAGAGLGGDGNWPSSGALFQQIHSVIFFALTGLFGIMDLAAEGAKTLLAKLWGEPDKLPSMLRPRTAHSPGDDEHTVELTGPGRGRQHTHAE